MPLVTLNGYRILTATLALPLSGRASLVATVDTVSIPEGRVTLKAPGITWEGAIRPGRSGTVKATAQVQAIAGLGKLHQQLTAKQYRAIQARLIAADIVREAGEVLSSTSTIPNVTPETWMRHRATAAGQLDALGAAAGFSWRVLDDGSIWCGVEAWRVVEPATYVLTSDEPAAKRATYALEGLDLRPGLTFVGRRLSRVTYQIEAAKTRVEVEYG